MGDVAARMQQSARASVVEREWLEDDERAQPSAPREAGVGVEVRGGICEPLARRIRVN